MRTQRDVDLEALNTLALPSRAAHFARVVDEAELEQALAWARGRSMPVFVLGGGSNLVLSSELDALVVQLANRGIAQLRRQGSYVECTIGAGTDWHALVVETLARGWYGLENLALIPGTAGAAPVQNIGAYGVELERFVVSVRAYDLQARRWRNFDRRDCGFRYRDSVFRHRGAQRYIIHTVTLRLQLEARPEYSYGALAKQLALQSCERPTPRDVFRAVVAIRRSKLPAPDALPNAGSFFKNPLVSHAQHQRLRARYPDLPAYPQGDAGVKLAAGWLIERAGLKGAAAEGGVGMHSQQALVLVNYGGATAAGVLAYADRVRAAVQAQFAVALEREPQWIRADGSRA